MRLGVGEDHAQPWAQSSGAVVLSITAVTQFGYAAQRPWSASAAFAVRLLLVQTPARRTAA